jgi:Bardet-Biedl syndrome 2 protein
VIDQMVKNTLHFQTTGGASSIAVGKTGRIKKSLAIVGGQSALQGFDEEGNEPLWTLTGDNVAVLMLFDINKDGQIEVKSSKYHKRNL